MTLGVKIEGDNAGFVEVEDQALYVSKLPYPPLNVPQHELPFIGLMTVGGDETTSALNVDGSVSPIDAFIGPPLEGDLYITTANVLIADSGAVALNKFGSGAALTNGIDFFVELSDKRRNVSIGLKSNFDFIRISTLTQGIGGKNDAYQLAATDPANDDGYNPIIDFTTVSSEGIRMIKGSNDKLGICINDDLSGVATFNIIVVGKVRI